MKQNLFTKLFLLSFCIAGYAHADINTTTVTIGRFQEVAPGIYRGARPSEQDLQTLSIEGLKTDIDLENDTDATNAEAGFAKSFNLDFLLNAMSGFWIPNDAEVNTVQAALNNPDLYPVFIHCEHGEDRTGLMVGLYRVFTEHWTVAAAYQEMLSNGFHPMLLGLHHYWDEKTAGQP